MNKPIIIELDTDIRRDAWHEAIEREPYVLNKYNESYKNHLEKIADGICAERHVFHYLEKIYGLAIELALNNIKDPCPYDFSINTKDRKFKFDVKSYPKNNKLTVEINRLSQDVDYFISVLRGADAFRIDGIADKKTLTSFGKISDDKKKLIIETNKLISIDSILEQINKKL